MKKFIPLNKIMNRKLTLSLAILMTYGLCHAENWTRISVASDGIYGITYDRLKEMGFPNPEKVGVMGIGSSILPIENSDIDLSELRVPVLHENNTLFFFGKGPESLMFTDDINLDTKGYFFNLGRNVYTDYGYYYLSDAEGVKKDFETVKSSAANAKKLDWGVSYIYYENELFHNSTDTGDLFWGEKFNGNNPSSYTWDIDTKDAADNSMAVVDLAFYTEKGLTGTLTYGTSSNQGMVTQNNCMTISSNLVPLNLSPTTHPIKKGKDSFSITYSSKDNTSGIANLDYWVLSYKNDLTNLYSGNQHPVSFPGLEINENAYFPCSSSKNLYAFDITDSQSPLLLSSRQEGDGFFVKNLGKTPIVMVFDPTTKQKEISDWKNIAQDPREKTLEQTVSQNDVSFIIISTEELMPYAEEIAEIHREHDGIKVVTATIEDVFREFSAGLPDPEAYRRFALTTYNNNKDLSCNLLLIGAVTNDARRSFKNSGYASSHIIRQSPTINMERGAYPLYDYYVAFNNNLDITKLERETLSMGIGILPFINEAETKDYVNKLRDYITNPAHNHYVNEWLFVGGTGDEHTHDLQCVDLNDDIQQNTENSFIGSVLAVDAYGENEAKSKLLQYLSSGKSLLVYFGHAGNAMMGKDAKFFTTEDVHNLKNSYLPFIITAGCSFTDSDLGKRGLGEEWVIGTPYGAIGGIVSQRETWSGQNYDFVNSFAKVFSGVYNYSNVETIGDVYVYSKNSISNTNEHALALMCDPALRIPLPLYRMTLTGDLNLTPNSELTVSGSILDDEGNIDESFNGKVTVKLAEPAETLLSEDLITAGSNGGKELYVTYADRIATINGGDIKNGKFTVKIPTPAYFNRFKDKEAIVYVSGYDPATSKSAVSSKKVMITNNNGSQPKEDLTAPVITDFRFDNRSNKIFLTVSDDNCVNLSLNTMPSSRRLTVDGFASPYINLVVNSINNSGKEVVFESQLPTLKKGNHKITAEFADLADNRTMGEFIISIEDPAASLSIEMIEKGAFEQSTFALGNNSETTILTILDLNDNIIRKIEAGSSPTVTWDIKDEQGRKVVPGIYKAYLSDDANTPGIKRYSQTIVVPVI